MNSLSLLNVFVNIFNKTRLLFCAGFLALLALPALSHAAPGDLDSSFGSGGVRTTAVGFSSGASAVAVQPDGKIVVVGTTTNTSNFSNAFVSRYFADGTLEFTNTVSVGISNNGHSVALQNDGKIVVVGTATVSSGIGNVFIARYHANGSLEFANTSAIGASSSGTDVAIQTDGKIVVTGSTVPFLNSPSDVFVARYFSNGSLEFSNVNGIGFASSGNSVAIQTDGKIVVTGSTVPAANNPSDAFVARYFANGNLDFANVNGIGFSSSGNSVALQADGKIVVTGSTVPAANNPSDSFVARFFANGNLEFSDVAGVGFSSAGTEVVVQPNGKIVVTGVTTNSSNFSSSFTSRYTAGGALDAGFGSGGTRILTQGISNSSQSVALQPDGKIVIAGGVTVGSGIGNSFVARYIGDFPFIDFTKFNFDGDSKDDISIFHPDNNGYGYWQIFNSSNSTTTTTQWGINTDRIAPADYDGDDKTDITIFRNGIWYILQSSTNSLAAATFGLSGDSLVPADYDGDAKADVAVFRQGVWYILQSSNAQVRSEQFGVSTDKPIVGDFDADGRSDLAVYRSGVWYVNRSFFGYTSFSYGVATDTPVAADYDADGKTDYAVYRPSTATWHITRSSTGLPGSVQFGISTDTPVPADYDGDQKADIAVFRSGDWFVLRSSDNSFFGMTYGVAGDIPAPSAYIP